MTVTGERFRDAGESRPRRADAVRNSEALLAAAASVFVAAGVEAPLRDIAEKAGVGTATIYRHYPTRADLIVAVYRHQVEGLVESGPRLLTELDSPLAALGRWLEEFAGFVVTKLGLPAVLQSDDPCFDPLHTYFLDRLGPVCQQLLDAAAGAGETAVAVAPVELMRAVAGLCGGPANPRYDAGRMVRILVAGLAVPPAAQQ